MRYIILLIIFIILGQRILAKPDSTNILVLREPLKSVYMNVYQPVEWLEDSSGTLSFEDVQNNPAVSGRFKHSGALLKPAKGSTTWLRFSIYNASDHDAYYLLYLSRLIRRMQLYECSGERVRRYSLGAAVPHADKPVPDANNELPLLLYPGEIRTYYIRLQEEHIMTGLLLQREPVFRSHWYFYGIYLGVSLVLILISLMLALIFGDRQFFLFALPVAGMLLWFGDINGDLNVYLHVPASWDVNGWLSGWLAPVSVLLFAIFYVRVDQKMRWAFYTTVILCVCMIGVSWMGVVSKAWVQYLNDLVIASILIWLAVPAWLALKFRDRNAAIFLLFMAPFMVAAATLLLESNFVISAKADTTLIMQIGSLISNLIIGYELYNRVHVTVQERMQVIRENQKLVEEQNVVLEHRVEERTLELKAEKEKSESILLNILPAEVAEELKENGKAKAKLFDDVTVLFTDFVNFTGAGELMSPQGLVDELHACFSAFDAIVSGYGIEKIKTIGDAYLAVAGLPVADGQHACKAVQAALDIQEFMQRRRVIKGRDTFEMRIGIHSGPVVAGIVGVKKFAYDIWGDAVNTAARMEQHGAPGKINISESTYRLIKDDFTCSFRGEISAKNKGALNMYFVERKIAPVYA